MKQGKTKKGNAENAPSRARVKSLPLLVLGGVVAVATVGLVLYFFIQELGVEPKKPLHSATEAGAPSNLLDVVIQRAYAIDNQFQRVYTPGWEGANGAIGEAYLYAATGDENLLTTWTHVHPFAEMYNGTWVDDRAWICLAELTWWRIAGRKNSSWVEDARKRYDDARNEGRLSHHAGFWSWYNWSPTMAVSDTVITNSNMNQMVEVACLLYDATHDQRFYRDAILVWEGDGTIPGIEKTFYRGEGKWEGKGGKAAFGKQLPWEEASYCSVGAALYRMTGNVKYKDIVAASAKRIMDPASGWIDSQDYYQLRMDGNGAFVHFILDAYLTAPELLPDVPDKIARMLDHVWTNHHGAASVTLHRPADDGIRNGWNPYGGEEGYNVNEVGTVHAQSQAVRAFGVFAYVLHERLKPR